MPTRPDLDSIAESLRQATVHTFPGHVGLELVELGTGTAVMRCEIQPFHMAPNGFLHAGVVITLADTAAGYGCVASWPEGATGFTTIELKTNFTGTLLQGTMRAEASMVHGGRTTQVWDVDVTAEDDGSRLALFRATQMLLYPKT
ncbi:MAG TPA: PaaI family thioesterase [Acidimicrobiia bacterium]